MKRRPRTDPSQSHGPAVEHIPSLITLYKDSHVHRPPTVPTVPASSSLPPSLTCRDVMIDPAVHLWARLYLPLHPRPDAPTLIYFHGGGFCVGSPSWSVYHLFLSRAAASLSCPVLSVAYRLAPEHRLPAAYYDGLAALKWARQQPRLFNARDVFLVGDSAGANVAYNVAARAPADAVRGVVLMQPFFGREERTWSEVNLGKGQGEVLSLGAADCYWRMALPPGAGRDHEYCDPTGRGRKVVVGPMMVCMAEMDVLRDGNLRFCREAREGGGEVESVVYDGVGHAFHVLGRTELAEVRTRMMLDDVKDFVTKYS